MIMSKVNVLIVGAGGRGAGFARLIGRIPERAKVVGVAEPVDVRRSRLVDEHGVPPENVFRDWREAAEAPPLADAVVIATQDRMHVEPAEAFAAKGYHMLLEKPMAPDEVGCRRIVQAIEDAGVIFAVCHVLRYTAYTRRLKQLVDDGLIGQVASVDHIERVGWWHYAHSYVRGNWRNQAESSSMLLAKSCHDLDWLRHILGLPCRRVQSFGSLLHFRTDQAPAGAGDRCLHCSVEADCPYSARRIYLEAVRAGRTGWPVAVIVDEVTEANVLAALEEGPYGRCVYRCDNDVVDHQVVNMEFAQGRTASFTMTGFTEMGDRQTTLFGTAGKLVGDGKTIRHFDFLSGQWRDLPGGQLDGDITSGHGGGDWGVLDAFIDAVATGERSRILSGPRETLETHRMVFAAERSRLRNTVESLGRDE
jgi:predicted dehydrogenase